MNALEIEKKYIEERVRILRALQKKYGKKIIGMSANAKKKLIYERMREQYKGIIPVDIEQFFRIIFGDFEGIDRMIDFKLLEKTESTLKVRVNRCWYADIYRRLNAQDIGHEMVCMMDPSMNRAINPKIRMSRPKKLMSGDECCIFEYRLVK